MPHYRVYLWNDGHIYGGSDLKAADDGDAVALAGRIMDGRAFEIWSGDRLVKAHDASFVPAVARPKDVA